MVVTVKLQDLIEDLEFQAAVLSPSPYLQQILGFFGLLYLSQELFCLAADAIHQLVIGIGNPLALQNSFSRLTANAAPGAAIGQVCW